MIGPQGIETTDTLKLLEWSREYGKLGPYQQAPLARYGIGVYQIAQGMKWTTSAGDPPRHESYAAACIHFMIACEQLEAHLETRLPKDMTEFPRTCSFDQWERLLFRVAAGQRMMNYSIHFKSTNTKWAARFKPDTLASHVARAIELLIGMVPTEQRASAFYEAMEEMSARSVTLRR